MHNRRCHILCTATIGLIAACTEPSTVAPAAATDAVVLSLADVWAPTITDADLVQVETVDHEGDRDRTGPQRVAGTYEERPTEQIFRARTNTGFRPGFAFSYATHEYIGNMSSVTTTANVAFQDAHLGSQSAVRQDYTIFLTDFGRLKRMWTWAKVFSDRTCGLSVQGTSEHRAWWQFFQGSSAPVWGVAIQTTQGSPENQTRCATGSTTVGEAESNGRVCYYLITYDLHTGGIVAVELLQCIRPGSTFL